MQNANVAQMARWYIFYHIVFYVLGMVSDGVSSCNLPLTSWHHGITLKKSLHCFPRFPEVGQALKPHSSVEETRKRLSIWHGVISSEFWVQWCQQNPADFLAGTHPTINLQQFGCQAQSILRLSVTFLHNTAWIVLTVSGCWGVGVGRTPCSSQIFSAIKFAWQTISHASSNVRR